MSKKKERRKKCGKNTGGGYGSVQMPIFAAAIGGIGLIFFLPLLAVSIVTKAGAGLTVIAALFCLGCILLILTVNQRIDYTPEGFVYRDMLRISRRYDYSRIKRIRYSKDIYIFVGRRIILIDSMAEGGRKFARTAARFAPNAEFITDNERGLFGGNIASPEEFILVYVVIGLLPLGMMLWAVVDFREVNIEELAAANAPVSGYYFDEREEDGSRRIKITFEGIEGEFYSWRFYEGNAEFVEFSENVQKGNDFEFYYDPNDRLSGGSIKIYEINCGGRAFDTVEEYNENEREMRRGIIFISAVSLVLWLLYVAISSYVMSNADKFPRLARLFVKSEYIIKK